MKNEKPIALLAKDLGSSLAAYRLSRNLRQDDVASLAGVSRGVVARLEAGEGGTLDSLIRVLRAMELEERISTLVPSAVQSPLNAWSGNVPRRRARPIPEGKEQDELWSWGE